MRTPDAGGERDELAVDPMREQRRMFLEKYLPVLRAVVLRLDRDGLYPRYRAQFSQAFSRMAREVLV